MWGPATTAVATIALTLSGLLVHQDRVWIWLLVLPSASFILIHATVVAVRELSTIGSLVRNYDRALRRVIELLYHLGDLTSFDAWTVDVYLPVRRVSRSSRFPFLTLHKRLSRQLSVALLDARYQPPLLDIDSGPHGMCHQEEMPLLWFDPRYFAAPPPSIDNVWTSLDSTSNTELGRTYGVLGVSPLVDSNGTNCVGVLAVHVASDRHKAIHAHGALCSEKGLGHIRNTSEQLNGIVSRQ